MKAALERGLSETDALAALTTIPAKLCGMDKQLGTIEPGKIANLTIVDGKGYFDTESRVREVWVDGRNYHVQAAKEEAKKDELADKEKEAKAKAEKEKKDAELKELQNKRVARSPMDGRGAIVDPTTILIQNATIWTCGPQGIARPNTHLERGEIDIRSGKILNVGLSRLAMVSKDVLVINATALHITQTSFETIANLLKPTFRILPDRISISPRSR